MKYKNTIYIILTVFTAIFSIVGFVKASVLGFDTSDPCTYWKDVFDFGMGAAGILTLVMLVVGGLYYIVSLGQEERLGSAKSMMGGAMIGFLLAIFSYLIFQVISPSLLQCRIDVPEVIQPEAIEDEGGGLYSSEGPNGPADPCAGVADEDLKDSQELCEGGGGREGGSCDGTCLQIPEIPAEEVSEEDDTDEEDVTEEGSEESTEEDDDSIEEENVTLSNTNRAGKWCCAGGGSCNDVARLIEEGQIIATPAPTRDLQDGIGTRTCSWMSSRSYCSNANPCGGDYSQEVPVDQRICSMLVALVEQGGFTPRVTNVVQGHGRCRRCQNEGASYPCNRDSSHWHGTAMDLAPDDDIQRWIAENVAVDSLYGPLGLPQSERSHAQSDPSCQGQQSFRSPYIINRGSPNVAISCGTAATHRQHIHVDYDFN